MTDDEVIAALYDDPSSCVHCYQWAVDRRGRMYCPVKRAYLSDLYAQGVRTCWYWLKPPVLSLEYEIWQDVCNRREGNSG